MEVTRIRLDAQNLGANGALLCHVWLEFDGCLAMKDLRLCQDRSGPFLVFPDRKKYDRCPTCSRKMTLDARFCWWCGRARETAVVINCAKDLFVSVAYPICQPFRDMVALAAIAAYRREMEEPGSVESIHWVHEEAKE
jgi:DNA-binding cell septation regulator SpoVG